MFTQGRKETKRQRQGFHAGCLPPLRGERVFLMFRGCRFAQPPAIGCKPFGLLRGNGTGIGGRIDAMELQGQGRAQMEFGHEKMG